MPSYCCSSSDFLQSHYTVFFSLFHAPLDVVVHFLVFLRSFRLKAFLSQFSPFVAQINNVCSGKVFFFWRCLPKISMAVSVTAVLKVVIIESMSVSSLLMMVRGANLPPIIAWKLSNTLGSFSFSRSNLSLVCFGLLIFVFCFFGQAKVEGHHQQVVITSIVCSWKTSCSGNVHSWSEGLPHKNVINLVVVLSIWAMPCPSSGCFVMTKCVRRHKVVNFFPTHRTLGDDRKCFPSRRVSYWWTTSTASYVDASHTGVRH